jgi:hypothetical protein
MMMKRRMIVVITLCASILLVSCAGSSSPAAVVEAYYNALVAGDAPTLTQLSCADWEQQSKLMLDSFTGVKARVDSIACSEQENDGSSVAVNCTGKIIATYGTEDQEINLSNTTFLLQKQGNEWLVCGQK